MSKSGDIFVADYGNGAIKRIKPSGFINTIYGPENGFWGAVDIVIDSKNNLLVLNQSGKISRISPSGLIGEIISPNSWDTIGFAIDINDDMYLADNRNHCVRKVTSEGVDTVVAGVIGQVGDRDGNAAEATFNQPWDVALDNNGNIFVVDFGNNKIRKISKSGIVSTFAGNGDQSATFNGPQDLVVDSFGSVLVADPNNQSIRKISQDGKVLAFAGSGWGAIDGDNATVKFGYSVGIALDRNCNIFVIEGGGGGGKIRVGTRIEK